MGEQLDSELVGKLQAAMLSGDQDKAKAYYANFLALTATADNTRPEVEQVEAYLAQR